MLSIRPISTRAYLFLCVRQPLANSTVMWPNREENPINEFNMEGYFTHAFPFPTGAAEFLAPRIHRITIGT